MQGIEGAYCEACIEALLKVYENFMNSSVIELLMKVEYGKPDTMGLDAEPEITIKNALRAFDKDALLITEETDDVTSKDWPTNPAPAQQPKMFFSDPTDRSKFLKRFLEKIAQNNGSKKVGEIMSRDEAIKIWEKDIAESPAIITGATSSITFVNKGRVIFTVMLNYIARVIIVACDIGIAAVNLPEAAALNEINLERVFSEGNSQKVAFISLRKSYKSYDDQKRFVTFLGKSVYPENFIESRIIPEDYNGFIHHREPGGPARVLYLSNLQEGYGPIGFVLGNGEKIGEWIPWCSFVKFARNRQGNPALKMFEITTNTPRMKDGILMSTAKAYSIFNCETRGNYYIDVSRIKNFDRPSKFRSTLVVAPVDNEKIVNIMARHEYRDVSDCL